MKTKLLKWSVLAGLFLIPFAMGAGCDASCRAKDEPGIGADVDLKGEVKKAEREGKDVKIEIEHERK